MCKEATKKITQPFLSKLAALVTVREHPLHEKRREFVVTSGDEDLTTDIVWRRRSEGKRS